MFGSLTRWGWAGGKLLSWTQSCTDTRTAGPSDETLFVPLEGTAQGCVGCLFKIRNPNIKYVRVCLRYRQFAFIIKINCSVFYSISYIDEGNFFILLVYPVIVLYRLYQRTEMVCRQKKFHFCRFIYSLRMLVT